MEKSLSGLGSLENQNSIFSTIYQRGLSSIEQLKTMVNKPSYDKEKKTYTISEVERLLDISRVTIRDNEKKGNLVYSNSEQQEGKKEYNLNDINKIREYFGKGFFSGKTKRPDKLDPIVISLAMFKGGVGKTTQSSHLAAHCAIKGLKTLLIDLDPQASATLTLGYVPSIDIQSGNTIYDSLVNDPSDIFNIIKNTHYDGLDIVTAGLELQGADLALPNPRLNNEKDLGSPLLRLKKVLTQDRLREYDVIILDLAPNHGAITMNALVASDGIILPLNPTMLAYGSSIQFIQTLEELCSSLLRYKHEIISSGKDTFNELEIIEKLQNIIFRVLITNDEMTQESEAATEAIRSLYGGFVLPRTMLHTIALPRTSNDLSLLYDMKRSQIRGAKEAFDRGYLSMSVVNDDILELIKSVWGLV